MARVRDKRDKKKKDKKKKEEEERLAAMRSKRRGRPAGGFPPRAPESSRGRAAVPPFGRAEPEAGDDAQERSPGRVPTRPPQRGGGGGSMASSLEEMISKRQKKRR